MIQSCFCTENVADKTKEQKIDIEERLHSSCIAAATHGIGMRRRVADIAKRSKHGLANCHTISSGIFHKGAKRRMEYLARSEERTVSVLKTVSVSSAEAASSKFTWRRHERFCQSVDVHHAHEDTGEVTREGDAGHNHLTSTCTRGIVFF